MTLWIKSSLFMTLSTVLYEDFLRPIMTGRWPNGQSRVRCWNWSITKAIPSFINLSRFGRGRAISAIMPIWKKSCLSVKVMRRRRRMWLKKNHSRISGDPAHDDNDDRHWSEGHVIARSLGSTYDTRPGFWENLSGSIEATLWSLAPPSFSCPWCRNTPPKT